MKHFIIALLLITPLAHARGVYLSADEFIQQAFDAQVPQARVLWLNQDIRQQITAITGHPPAGLRVRYHQLDNKTAWILDEIGKDEPITIGVVVVDRQIQSVKILAFRESRGDEVRYPAFTRQYRGAALTQERHLSQPIDGITGATLSVRAVNKVAASALYYHSLTEAPTDTPREP